jgi:uncharacterized protein YuzB (UPF0349 family)
MQQLGLRLLKHHVANIDSGSANVVKEVLEAAPDLDLLDLYPHCSVADHSDKCSGAGLADHG